MKAERRTSFNKEEQQLVRTKTRKRPRPNEPRNQQTDSAHSTATIRN
jgi:hypothetical protein